MTRAVIMPSPQGVPYVRVRVPSFRGSLPARMPYAAIAAVPTTRTSRVVQRGLATNILAAVPPGYQLGARGMLSNLPGESSPVLHGDVVVAGREFPVDTRTPVLGETPPAQPPGLPSSERLEGVTPFGNSTDSVP